MSRIEDVYGLTPVQEGMYAQYFLHKETEFYHLYYLFSVNGDTDLSLLRQALDLLPLRHPVLKTAFAAVEGALKQVILANRVPEINTRVFNAPYTADSLSAAVREEKARPFDLQRDPLVRCTFLLFPDRRFLFFHTHHLILDGWCASVLFEDLNAYYGALANGTPAAALARRAAAERAAQPSFASYVGMIRGRDPGKARQYWQTLLEGAVPAALPGPLRPAACGGRFLRIAQTVLPAAGKRITAFARANALPVNAVLESAFALALQKHTGREEAVFFKVISGRSFGAFSAERTLGPMINTVPVRSRREEGQTARGFLARMNEQAVSAGEFGFLPLAEVCRGSGIDPRSVQIVFDYGNYDPPGAGGPQPLSLTEQSEQTEFPLAFVLSPDRDGGFNASVSFNVYLFSEYTVRSLLNSFLFILAELSDIKNGDFDSPAAFRRLRRLTPAESETLFGAGGFCSGPCAPVPQTSLYAQFRMQAKKTPDENAVLFGDLRITYAALLRQADEAAQCLRYLGVGKGDAVAIYLDRSPWLIILQIAVFKLGAVYLPVDKRSPEERLRFICADSAARLLVTDASLSAPAGIPIVSPEDLRAPGADGPCEEVYGGDTCYIIYTSGSTGVPKGCLLRQSGVLNFCVNNNTLAVLKKNSRNVFACVNSAAFDYFIAESLLPLLNGCTVALCGETESVRRGAFLEAVRKHRINVLMTTPTRLSLFYDGAPGDTALAGMDCVCSSGEPLTEPLLLKIRAASPHAAVFNPLGPSECTVWDLGGELDGTAGIHLGKPVANTRAYILDPDLAPVPVGVTGELCIAGAGVGGGYLNRPDLTEEKFVNDPFGEGKLYKTGDLAFWREDGRAAFAGRIDAQLKLRGQRIEPGEIEAALTALEGVESAAAVLRGEDPERRFLCAYYTGAPRPARELRALLGKTLPRYMVPTAFVHTDALPLTVSGKTDRAALCALPLQEPAGDPAVSPPQTETERAVCAAFSAVLGVEEIGRDSDFHDLGGTSLMLIKLLSFPPLEKLSPAEFLADPTPAGAAKKLDAAGKSDYTYVIPLYTPPGAKKAVVLFPFAGGDAAAFAALTAAAREEKREFSLYFTGWEAAEALPAAAEEIRRIAKETDVYFYSHCAGAALALALLDTLNETEPLVRGYIAGANIPPRRASGFNVWAHMSDAMVLRSLRNAGLQTAPESDSLLHGRLERFRAHTLIYGAYFREKKQKTNVTVKVVVSTKDPFTSDYADAEARWKKAVSDVARVVLTDTPSHYFQNTDTGLLLRMFDE